MRAQPPPSGSGTPPSRPDSATNPRRPGSGGLDPSPAGVDRLLERLLEGLRRALPCAAAAVLERSGEELVLRASTGATDALEVLEDALLRDELARALAGERVHVAGGSGPGLAARGRTLVPLPGAESTDGGFGVLLLVRADGEPFDLPARALAEVQAELVAIAMRAADRSAVLDDLRARLEERNRLLEGEVSGTGYAGARIEGFPSAAMRGLARTARQVAVTDAPVLISGETGSGKEVLARAIHGWSRRARGPFVKLNCAALPEGLVESELFGHLRGAFSGATASRPGRFAVADGGTLLLDEVGDLPAGAQAKLLRVLQEGSFEPVGSDRTVQVNVRIVAATHVDLECAIEEGRFRRDLFYRLNVLPMHVPPLRERTEDISRLARELLTEIARRTGRGPWRLSDEVLERMRSYRWPGNVRELVNVLERATVLSEEGELRVNLPARRGLGPGAPPLAPLREVERAHLRRVLDATGGKIYGPGGAAEVLGLKPSTLQSRMKRLGVDRLGHSRSER